MVLFWFLLLLTVIVFVHELGHYFSLFHIEGIWMFNDDFKKEYVNREECGIILKNWEG